MTLRLARALTPQHLPPVPFALSPGVTVVDAARFLEGLRLRLAHPYARAAARGDLAAALRATKTT